MSNKHVHTWSNIAWATYGVGGMNLTSCVISNVSILVISHQNAQNKPLSHNHNNRTECPILALSAQQHGMSHCVISSSSIYI